VGALVYQVWAVRRRAPSLRTVGMKAILALSLMINGVVIGLWVALSIRYR
jgi:hypothetical protein